VEKKCLKMLRCCLNIASDGADVTYMVEVTYNTPENPQLELNK